nr:PREDICTED: uncharacterized protein C2orf73 homolog isoform X2 [Latimeria chalumnae]|eukprot:XP_014353421.1 PREDICTED: uncharacterized protein C2orf73 homolog isoform X2 [Latimeria chalumnae]
MQGCWKSPNTNRIFNEDISDTSLGLERYNLEYSFNVRKPPQCLQIQEKIPHPCYAKSIRANTKFYNEPILYIDIKDTTTEKFHWLRHETPCKVQHVLPYSKQTTQRSEFQDIKQRPPAQTRHGSNPYKTPASGIVPLATPRGLETSSKNLLERMTFHYLCGSSKPSLAPVQRKRHGAFVWTEIKPVSGLIAPKGADAFLNTLGSGSLEQSKTKRGNSVEGKVTSPKLCSLNSQQMFNSGTQLSKTDMKEAAKAYPRIPAKVQTSSSISQTAEVLDVRSKGEECSVDPIVASPNGSQGRITVAQANTMTPMLPASTAVYCQPSNAT